MMPARRRRYKSLDGVRWVALPFKRIAEDDTKPTAYYDPALRKYVVSVRRDCASDGSDCARADGSPVHALSTRYVGRCVTSNISDWQADVHGPGPQGEGCAVVFGPDSADPGSVDVYTNAWTPYPSINNTVAHLYFPSFYHHFGTTPWGFGNDGLLDIRMVFARSVCLFLNLR